MNKRENLIRKVNRKIQEMIKSRDINYICEYIKIEKDLVFEILCHRAEENIVDDYGNITVDNKGLAHTIEIYVLKNGNAIECSTERVGFTTDYTNNIDYLISCVTDWN